MYMKELTFFQILFSVFGFYIGFQHGKTKKQIQKLFCKTYFPKNYFPNARKTVDMYISGHIHK